MKTLATSLALCAVLTASSAAQATLVERGGGLIYDTDLNVTWLANANLAATNTFGAPVISANGVMDWYTAQFWINGMNIANYLGYHDWRLPTTQQPDATCYGQSSNISYGFGCTGSEMGHLFYNELGGNTGGANLALFQNAQHNGAYWSDSAANSSFAWGFDLFRGGYQDNYLRTTNAYALAVRRGDVATVPVPTAAWLLGSGLLGLLGAARRKAS